LADSGSAGDNVPTLPTWTGRRVFATAYLANVAWLCCEAGYARRLSDEAIQRASELGHAQTSAQAYYVRSLLEIFRDDPAATLRSAKLAIATASEHGMQVFAAAGNVHSAWARSRLLSPQADTVELRRVIGEYVKLGNRIGLPLYLGLLAEREMDGRAGDAALATIDEALAVASETGEHLYDAFLSRLRGDILFSYALGDPRPSEQAYLTAIAVAKEQGARSFGLQAALKLGKL
jgi:predicted ATPase